MKAAAAVLAASLLFFVGVLTGAGRRSAVPAPGAITLGVVQPSSPSGAPGSSPAVPAPKKGTRATTTAPSPSGTAPTPASPSNPSGAGGGNGGATTGAPGGGPATPAGPTGAPATTNPNAPAGPSPTATTNPSGGTTTSTAPSGQVQQVDNQIDCAPAGKKGRGHRSPCPSSTPSTTSAPAAGDGTGGRSRP